ncbi:MAG: LysR family transcriptional regulator [Mangrovicoccus sp.]
MDLRQLKHFAAVAQTLHFGQAADLLGMTQPPLSQSIKALEAELGMALFQRSRRSVALTAFGATWLEEVRPVLAQIEALPQKAAEIREGWAGRLELSFVSTADYSVLPALVHRYRQLYPDVTLALTEATSDRQIAELVEGKGQVGIIIPQSDASLPSGFAYRCLLREPLIAAVPESWITEGRIRPENRALAADRAVRLPLIVFPRRAAPLFHDLVTGFYTARGARPEIVQNAIQMQTIISLVSAGMGMALVPASLRNLARLGVRYLDLTGPVPELETGLIWRQENPAPVLQNFLNVVTELGLG